MRKLFSHINIYAVFISFFLFILLGCSSSAEKKEDNSIVVQNDAKEEQSIDSSSEDVEEMSTTPPDEITDTETAIRYFRYRPLTYGQYYFATANASTNYFLDHLGEYRKLSSEEIRKELPGKWYFIAACAGYSTAEVTDSSIIYEGRKPETWYTEDDKLFESSTDLETWLDFEVYDIGNGYYLLCATYKREGIKPSTIWEPVDAPKYRLYAYDQKDKPKGDSFTASESSTKTTDTDNKTKPSNTQGKICYATGCNRVGTHTITGISGSPEYYCDEHYNEMNNIIGGMEEDVGGGSYSKHKCDVSGCNKEGTHTIRGLGGDHYNS